jgi:hypothetical protein
MAYLAYSIGYPFNLTSFPHGNQVLKCQMTTAILGDATGGDQPRMGLAKRLCSPMDG